MLASVGYIRHSKAQFMYGKIGNQPPVTFYPVTQNLWHSSHVTAYVHFAIHFIASGVALKVLSRHTRRGRRVDAPNCFSTVE
ncbi:unnamed protein product [Chondrus crispus]|uniref:Uncharacterized protein n=1 Tax=Chondrus crispus TaxID=2769 RepID=R7QCA2_CHOCR|nr:unnamed protein product [Chondrus crispus]CDF35031.1 unnamed protein product [Chondrus crispus]|eukprot:XP_005714850.1 unnamed protein product [Chondrus crispus]